MIRYNFSLYGNVWRRGNKLSSSSGVYQFWMLSIIMVLCTLFTTAPNNLEVAIENLVLKFLLYEIRLLLPFSINYVPVMLLMLHRVPPQVANRENSLRYGAY